MKSKTADKLLERCERSLEKTFLQTLLLFEMNAAFILMAGSFTDTQSNTGL